MVTMDLLWRYWTPAELQVNLLVFANILARPLVAAFAAAVLLYGESLRNRLLDSNRTYANHPWRLKFIVWVEKWGDASYSVFLIHYPVILLISSLMLQWDPQSTAADYSAWMLAWSLSLAAGLYLHRKVG